jgi:hypothetical protein
VAFEVSATDDGIGRIWSGLLSVAGAVAGLGTLIYLVGAATLWVRFDAAGLPADVALGVRGLIGIGFLLLAVIFLVFYVGAYLALRSAHREELARGKRLIDLIAERAKRLNGSSARQFGVWATLAIFAASLTTWQVLGLVIFWPRLSERPCSTRTAVVMASGVSRCGLSSPMPLPRRF